VVEDAAKDDSAIEEKKDVWSMFKPGGRRSSKESTSPIANFRNVDGGSNGNGNIAGGGSEQPSAFARMFQRSEDPGVSSRSDELAKITSEMQDAKLQVSPERKKGETPRWMRKLTEKAAEATTDFVIASQKLGESVNAVAKVTKNALSPIMNNGAEDGGAGEEEEGEYFIGKVVDVSEWIQQESFVDGHAVDVQTFSASRYEHGGTGSSAPCQLLISPTLFLAVELFDNGFVGNVIEKRDVARLNKITTNNVLHGLVVFHFNKKSDTLNLHESGKDKEEGSGIDLLNFIVEDHKECIQLMTQNFKALRKLKKEQEKAAKKKKEQEAEARKKEEEEREEKALANDQADAVAQPAKETSGKNVKDDIESEVVAPVSEEKADPGY
jgi:hypothetical protein